MVRVASTSSDIFLDYNEEDSWSVVVKRVSLGLSLSDSRVLLSLLPFLEMGRINVISQIRDSDALESFPELTLIEAGLKNGSEHWVRSAFAWLESQSSENLICFRQYFELISQDKKKYSQVVRQKAKAFLKEIGAKNGGLR